MERTSAALLYATISHNSYAVDNYEGVHFAAVVVVHLHPSHCVACCTTAALHCAEVCLKRQRVVVQSSTTILARMGGKGQKKGWVTKGVLAFWGGFG